MQPACCDGRSVAQDDRRLTRTLLQRHRQCYGIPHHTYRIGRAQPRDRIVTESVLEQRPKRWNQRSASANCLEKLLN